MNFTYEKSRDKHLTAKERIEKALGLSENDGVIDAQFLTADGKKAVAFLGLPYEAPICLRLFSFPEFCAFLDSIGDDCCLFSFFGKDITLRTEKNTYDIPENVKKIIVSAFEDMICAKGSLGPSGEHIIDLKMPRVGTHYDINLLLGCRVDASEPLLTTPKASLDSFGRGAFRSVANMNVTASRFDLIPEDSGEPCNRQFYIFEDGKQIFYSANAEENIADAFCVHAQNHTVITYETKCGLIIKRTIFILPFEDGMPDAVEAQRIEIRNIGSKPRKLKVVTTGMFALCSPESMTNDILYASITWEGAVAKKDGKPVAVCPIPNPAYLKKTRRFATLFCDGEAFDDFTENYINFIGRGTLEHPEHGAYLTSAHTQKVVPFYALGKTITLEPKKQKKIDCYVGIVSGKGDISPVFDEKFGAFADKYANEAAFDEAFAAMKQFYKTYSSYVKVSTGDDFFDSYVNNNLPFQVLYQSFVSRSFAWTQKSFREIGFREIQDVYASVYYMTAMGKGELARSLLSKWVSNVYKMGYANHNFFFSGKEPGFCSDDALWLTQAVYRYVFLTEDFAFLDSEFPVAGTKGETRKLWDTLMATIEYSGKISVGAHGLPLLDRADWNDALKLDDNWIDGPTKEKLYAKQLEETGAPYGTKFESNYCESVMNAFLLKIAYDNLYELAMATGRKECAADIAARAESLTEKIQASAWKENFFARALINHGEYSFLGAKGDGLGTDKTKDGSYFLNSFSWALLANVATEDEIRIMLDTIRDNLTTEYGPILCTQCDLERVATGTATGLYFRGDRENGGVFKHAAMMAAVASLKQAKKVKDESIATDLLRLGYGILDNVLPYKTLKNPFVSKGNPRFCTQYTNSITGENVGPMLSGTASWLTLAIFEMLGIAYTADGIELSPMLPEGTEEIKYTITKGAVYNITVTKNAGFARVTEKTKCTFDGKECGNTFPMLEDGVHEIVIAL